MGLGAGFPRHCRLGGLELCELSGRKTRRVWRKRMKVRRVTEVKSRVESRRISVQGYSRGFRRQFRAVPALRVDRGFDEMDWEGTPIGSGDGCGYIR